MLGVWFRFITFRKKFHLCLIKERNDCEADFVLKTRWKCKKRYKIEWIRFIAGNNRGNSNSLCLNCGGIRCRGREENDNTYRQTRVTDTSVQRGGAASVQEKEGRMVMARDKVRGKKAPERKVLWAGNGTGREGGNYSTLVAFNMAANSSRGGEFERGRGASV